MNSYPYIDSNLREAIFRDNRIVAAKEGLPVLIGLNDRVQKMLENIKTNPRKFVAGYRFFHCHECSNHWSEKSRDCQSSSGDICPKCGEINYPWDFEKTSRMAC